MPMDLLVAGLAIFALDFGATLIDPAVNRAGAEMALGVGPCPAGYEPLVKAATGLTVQSVVLNGNFTRSLPSTGVAFHRGLFVDSESLEPGVFIGTGSAENAKAPDDAYGTTTNFQNPSRADSLAEILTGGGWTYDSQRLEVELDTGGGTSSFTMRGSSGRRNTPSTSARPTTTRSARTSSRTRSTARRAASSRARRGSTTSPTRRGSSSRSRSATGCGSTRSRSTRPATRSR